MTKQRNPVAFRSALRCIAVAITLAACTASHPPATQTAAGPNARIVTLVPSFAEDVYAIGAGVNLVAVSAFTDEPQAKGLPRIADFTSVDTEKIVALHPDLVAGIPAQERLVEPLRHANVNVVLLPDDSFDRIFANLQALGALTGRQTQAARVIEGLKRETAALHARTRTFVRRPSVFLVLGSGPIWTAGTGSYISTLIDIAGGVNSARDMRAAYGEYSAEALLRDQPDVIVTDAAIHLGAVLDREPWRSLRAVQHGRVYAVDPAIIERPGPNYNKGLEWLIDRLQPLATQP
jgi:ABC-type Fe3+-hydroxamate transport system substrate-binding protein